MMMLGNYNKVPTRQLICRLEYRLRLFVHILLSVIVRAEPAISMVRWRRRDVCLILGVGTHFSFWDSERPGYCVEISIAVTIHMSRVNLKLSRLSSSNDWWLVQTYARTICTISTNSPLIHHNLKIMHLFWRIISLLNLMTWTDWY